MDWGVRKKKAGRLGVIGCAVVSVTTLATVSVAQEEADDKRAAGKESDDQGQFARELDEKIEPELDNHYEQRAEQPNGSVIENDELAPVEPKVTLASGMGSDSTYAEKGVVELGGTLQLDIRRRLLQVGAAPFVGYFFVDRVEVTLLPWLRIIQTEDEETGEKATNVSFFGIVEPSYHLPITDFFYGSVGLGVGLGYEDGPGVEALLRPVLGADLLIGRSGIFKPQFFMDVGLGDGALGGGFQGSFTVML